MACARLLLVLSSTLSIALGLVFLGAGVYGLLNTDLLNKYVDKLDLRSVPKRAALRQDIKNKLKDSGIVQTTAAILVSIGIYATCISFLGVIVGVSDSTIYAKIYIVLTALTLLGLLIVLLLLTVGTSIIEKPVQDSLMETLNRKFVSIVALIENKAGDGVAVSVVFNYLQLELSCCGIRKVGDIRSSRRWIASPRSLAAAMKLRQGSDKPTNEADEDNDKDKAANVSNDDETEDVITDSKNRISKRKLLSVDSDIPEWMKEHIPAGATLPSDANLPRELPAGFIMPKDFQLTEEMLKSGKAVNKAFEDSLVLKTPISCCRFKGKASVTTLDVRTLMSKMVDPSCPFETKNGKGMHNKTCYEKALNLLSQHSIYLIIGGSLIALLLTLNMGLAIRILLYG